MHEHNTILITVRGNDAPGITAALTGVIASAGAVTILDIEQTVIHGKLLLSILLGFDKAKKVKSSILKELLFAAKKLDVKLEFEAFTGRPEKDWDVYEYVITCIGTKIGARELSRISTDLAKHGINIDKISRLSHGSIRCIEMMAHAARAKNPKKISMGLLALSNEIGVDIAIQKYGLSRQAKRLVLLDMDSTLIRNEVIDELAKVARKYDRVARITKEAMGGKKTFSTSLKLRVAELKGLDERAFLKVYKKIKFTPGAENLVKILKHLGYKIAIISGGFTYFTDRIKKQLGVDYAYANSLEIKDGKVTGRVVGDIIDGKMKAKLLSIIARAEGIPLEQTIAIGDGANDIEMLSRAGLGVAFRAKPYVREKSAYSITKHKTLDSILYLLGISEKEVIRLNHKR